MSTFAPMATPATFLCVDDEPSVLMMAKLLLESAGFHVLTASSGAEAIATLQSANIDVVVMDYSMPGMSGIAAAQAMKRLKPDVLIVFLSAYTELPGETLGIAEWWAKKGEHSPEHLLSDLSKLVASRHARTNTC